VGLRMCLDGNLGFVNVLTCIIRAPSFLIPLGGYLLTTPEVADKAIIYKLKCPRVPLITSAMLMIRYGDLLDLQVADCISCV
jgi:hypothetical protein